MLSTKVYRCTEELPATLSADEIAIFLSISRANAYKLLNSSGFPTLRVGKRRLLVTKQNLLRWIEHNSGDIL